MLVVLVGIVLILSTSLILLLVDLHHITADLTYINTHTTNAGVTSQLHFGPIQQLTTALSATLNRTRTIQQTEYQHAHHLETMLLNLTHDIKTPLTVATGYVQLMQKQPATATPTTLQRILTNLAAVNYYLRYLMDFNLAQTKAAQLNLEPVNVSQFVEQELFSFFDELNAQAITVTPTITPNLMLTTDKLLFQRIIQNLVGNWLKYATETAAVTLAPVDDDHLKLSFSNHSDHRNGHVDAMTTAFYTTNADATQSLGLGLNIVQSLVTTLGGKLSLQTDDTTFTVQLIFRTTPPID